MTTKITYGTVITKDTFQAESRLSSVDLNNRPVQDNDLEEAFLACIRLENVKSNINSVQNLDRAFYNCTSLKSVPTIPNTCIYMEGTFQNCINFNAAVIIPQNVVNLNDCFNGCKNLSIIPTIRNCQATSLKNTFKNTSLEQSPDIRDVVQDMEKTFYDCKNLKTVVNFPTSLTNLKETFYNCTNLTNIPEIPNTVTNMSKTFVNCKNLTGDIRINSTQILDADDCFYLSNINAPDRNVYLPIPSTTYNSFVRAGYSETKRQHGVLLLPNDEHIVIFEIYIDSAGETPLEEPNDVSVEVQYQYSSNTITKLARNILSTYPDGYDISGLPKNKFFVTIPNNLSDDFNYTITPQGSLVNVVKPQNGTGRLQTQFTINLEREKKTFTARVRLNGSDANTADVKLYADGQYKKSDKGTASFDNDTGEILAVTIEAENTGYLSEEKTVTWDTNEDYTEEIILDPMIDPNTGTIEPSPEVVIEPEIIYEKLSYKSNKANERRTFTLYENYVYKITCVGGGGGSSYTNGGAGSAWIGNILVTDNNLTVNTFVGSGGAGGKYRPRNHDGIAGTPSSIKAIPSETTAFSIVAGGGHPGRAARKEHNHYTKGYSISPAPVVNSMSITYQQSFANTKKERRGSWISNKNYGSGGNGGYYKHGTGESGKNGYIAIEYIGSLASNSDGRVILEVVKSGSGSIQLAEGLYRLTLIGGGGGVLCFYDDTDTYYSATGGSGSGFKGTFYFEANTYQWHVGTAGTSVNKRNVPTGAVSDGGYSSFGLNVAHGGKAGSVENGVYSGGKGGAAPTIKTECYELMFNSAGKDGSTAYANRFKTVLGGESIYQIYGKGAGIKNGNFQYSAPGYLLLVKLGG